MPIAPAKAYLRVEFEAQGPKSSKFYSCSQETLAAIREYVDDYGSLPDMTQYDLKLLKSPPSHSPPRMFPCLYVPKHEAPRIIEGSAN